MQTYQQEVAQKDVEQPVQEQQKPKKTFFEAYGFVIVFIAVLLHFVFKSDKGIPFLDDTQFYAIAGAVLAWYLITHFANKKKEEVPFRYVPFNPEKELPEIREKVLREYGERITITDWVPDPPHGHSSSYSPHTIHFKGFTTEPGMVKKSVWFSYGLAWRNIIRWRVGIHPIETWSQEFSGTRKYVDENPFLSTLLVPAPRKISAVGQLPSVIEENGKEEKKNEEEE